MCTQSGGDDEHCPPLCPIGHLGCLLRRRCRRR